MIDFEKLGITEAHVIMFLLQKGKITIETAIKFHTNELTLEEVVKTIIKKDE